MYSPEMRVWEFGLTDWNSPTEGKERRANWQLVDISLEHLLALGLKPIYTTCFNPVGFTDDLTTTWPDRNPVGMPRDLAQWAEFVAGGVRHHQERFGRDELRTWYFECWNESNLPNFFSGTQEQFFQLWSATWHAIKSVDPELRIGGPSTARGEWVGEFLDWTISDGTPPDYIITHVYNNDSDSQPLSPFDGPASHRVKDSPDFASGVIRGLRKELDERGWVGEVHWNEWGRSWFPFDPAKETALEPAFIVRTMADVSQAADQFAFWCLSDIYDQVAFQSSEFQGNYGLLSLHGLRKPGWFAHVLLNRLGSSRVPTLVSDRCIASIATIDETRGCVLVSAYPDSPGDQPKTINVNITLPFNASNVALTRLGSLENNVVNSWREMGSPPYPTREELASLRAANILQTAPIPPQEMIDGQLIANVTMECPGVACLEFHIG